VFPYELEIPRLEGGVESFEDYRGTVMLCVNVASKCGLTPQYEGLVALHRKYFDQGLRVLGFPCNQFMGQEPGTAEEILSFCSTTYGVDFPLFEKIEVNGSGRHPLYQVLTQVPSEKGEAGDIEWNFEKFLVSRDGSEIVRFSPGITPEDPALVGTVERLLG